MKISVYIIVSAAILTLINIFTLYLGLIPNNCFLSYFVEKQNDKTNSKDKEQAVKTAKGVDNFKSTLSPIINITLFACYIGFIIVALYSTVYPIKHISLLIVLGILGGLFPIFLLIFYMAIFLCDRCIKEVYVTFFAAIYGFIALLLITSPIINNYTSNTNMKWVDTEYIRIIGELKEDGFNKEIIATAIEYNNKIDYITELQKYNCTITDKNLEKYRNGTKIDIYECIQNYVEENLKIPNGTSKDLTEPYKIGLD